MSGQRLFGRVSDQVALDVEAVGEERVIVDECDLNGVFERVDLGGGQFG